jgi:hypothetical protein
MKTMLPLVAALAAALAAQNPPSFARPPQVPAAAPQPVPNRQPGPDASPEVVEMLRRKATQPRPAHAKALLGVPVDPAAEQRLRDRPKAKAALEDLIAGVMFDRPRADGPLWAIGHTWKGSFDDRSFTYVPFFGSEAPQNFPLRLELTQASVGGEPLAVLPGQPKQSGTRIETPRGGLTEVFDLQLRQVEQSFVFETLPSRGAITVEVRMESELTCLGTEGGLRFGNAHGQIDYTKAVAKDANGRSLPLEIVWTGTAARIEISAAFVEDAALPLVLDPLLVTVSSVASGQTQLQRNPDVASLQYATGTQSLVVWGRDWSVTDRDCFGQFFDGGLTPIGSTIQIDFTSLSWVTASVASNHFDAIYLVAAQVDRGYVGNERGDEVVGRAVDSTGVGSEFGIATVPPQGPNPSTYGWRDVHVGGDPYPGPGVFCVVFRDCYVPFVPVAAPGTQVRLVDAVWQTSASPVTGAIPWLTGGFPSVHDTRAIGIGKSCGQTTATPANSNWMVTWVQKDFLESLCSARIRWDGVVGPGRAIVSVPNPQRLQSPAASSPADISGNRYWLVSCLFSAQSGSERDVFCTIMDANDNALLTAALGYLEDPITAVNDQFAPSVDSDGVRFVVGYTETNPASQEHDTLVSTLAWDPIPGSFRLEESRTRLGQSPANEVGTRICADHSGAGIPSTRYVVVGHNEATNDIEAYAYGGYSPGAQFSVQPTQCGTLPITYAGSTELGSTVYIDVANGPLSLLAFGTPGSNPLTPLGCSCVLGVNNALFYGNPFQWTVPPLPWVVGVTLSVQGLTLVGSQCLGFLDVSDTVDLTIR